MPVRSHIARWGVAATLLALPALGLASCGGGGSSGPLSHAQFVSRADADCHTTNAQIAALREPTELKELAGYAGGTRSAALQLHKSLATLKAPESDQAALNRYLTALEQGNTILERIETAAAANETATVRSLGKQLAGIPTATLATAAGLPACATATGSSTAG